MRALSLSLLLSLSLMPPLRGADDGEVAPAPPLLERVAVIGASASNGFGLKGETGAFTRLSAFVDAAVTGSHRPVVDASDSFFFWDPLGKGRRIVDRALASDPTLVVALDFLFWFAYGIAWTEESRLGRLELGLALLDELECPLLVGDVPYMPQAVGTMLTAEQLPAAATLERVNARIRAWCDERPRATLVPVADFARRAVAGAPIALAETELAAEEATALLLPDRLHPSVLGSASLVTLALDRLVAAHADLPRAALRRDPRELRKLVLAAESERRVRRRRRAATGRARARSRS